MADYILASLLLFGGAGWALLVVLAMMNHPTGGTNFPLGSFYLGIGSAALGAFWWLVLIVRAIL